MTIHRPSDGVAQITLRDDSGRNLIDNLFIAKLHEHLDALTADPALRCVILSAEGSVFSGGGRIQWLKSAPAMNAGENLREARELAALFTKLNQFPVPVIGRIHGAAIGGAVALVAACDIAVASADTVFSLSEARLGLVPACAAPVVLAKIGTSWTRRLFVTGERFTAEQALRIGLIHEIVPTQADLDHAVNGVVTNILACAPHASRTAKHLVLDLADPARHARVEDMNTFVARVLAEQRLSIEGQEGMAAFLEKRPPSWHSTT